MIHGAPNVQHHGRQQEEAGDPEGVLDPEPGEPHHTGHRQPVHTGLLRHGVREVLLPMRHQRLPEGDDGGDATY